MKQNPVSKTFLAAALIAGIAALGKPAQAASFLGLGDLPGGDSSSTAYGLTPDGTVVVGASSSSTSGSNPEASRWTQSGGMVGLGDLTGGLTNSAATGISSDGSVVVGEAYTGVGQEPFRWTQAGGMVGLGYLSAGSTNAGPATGVSADGSVVVGTSYTNSIGQAFRWTEGVGMVGLGTLGGLSSQGEAVSADGQVVVGRVNLASGQEAFYWTQAGGMVSIGDLPGGGSGAIAMGVSADGNVIVGFGKSCDCPGDEAFRWTEAGGMVGLGDLPGGDFDSKAFATTADGSVVVGSGTTGVGPTGGLELGAFYWTEAGGMQNLQTMLISQYGLDLTGWTLRSANDISGDGLFIVGFGTNPSGFQEAWLADLRGGPVPLPPAVWVFGSGLLGLLGVMRRRAAAG